ncbi:hypothetical protein GC177_00975 [bacterium]|nr:hypothetical protein [bacterium]
MPGEYVQEKTKRVINVKALGLAAHDRRYRCMGEWDHLWKISNPHAETVLVRLAHRRGGKKIVATYILAPHHSIFFIAPVESGSLQLLVGAEHVQETPTSHDIADAISLLKEGFTDKTCLHYHNDNLVGVRYDGKQFTYHYHHETALENHAAADKAYAPVLPHGVDGITAAA